MKKNIISLIIFLTFSTLSICPRDDWQLWVSTGISGKPHPKIKTIFNQENRIKEDMGEYKYMHLEPLLMFRIKKSNYFGFQIRQAFDKSTSNYWKKETRPAFVLTNKVKIGAFDLFARTKFFYRILENVKNRAAIRFRPGITLFKHKRFSIFARNEFFHNYRNFQAYDQNRFSSGFKIKIAGPIKCGTYYLFRMDKKSPGASWLGTHVWGISLSASV